MVALPEVPLALGTPLSLYLTLFETGRKSSAVATEVQSRHPAARAVAARRIRFMSSLSIRIGGLLRAALKRAPRPDST
jgi:hypothetical protein